MTKEHLTNDEFFTNLTTLIESTQRRGHGSIHLTQKRLTFSTDDAPTPPAKVADDPLWDLNPPNPLPIIIRASDGQSTKSDKTTRNPEKVKLSTVVQPDELEGFFARYAEVCKASMTGLRKRDRSKRKGKKKGKGGAGGGEGTKS